MNWVTKDVELSVKKDEQVAYTGDYDRRVTLLREWRMANEEYLKLDEDDMQLTYFCLNSGNQRSGEQIVGVLIYIRPVKSGLCNQGTEPVRSEMRMKLVR